MKKRVTGILLLFSVTAMSALNAQALTEHNAGKILFEKKCATCHGKEGDKGVLGAYNLKKSTLPDAQYFYVISNGRKRMPSWSSKLSTTEISNIIHYIKTFRP